MYSLEILSFYSSIKFHLKAPFIHSFIYYTTTNYDSLSVDYYASSAGVATENSIFHKASTTHPIFQIYLKI